jgi:hypothetical protein
MKISNTTAYPNESPVSLSDYLIGTETTTGDLETKTFTISGMFGLILDGTSYNLPLFYANTSGSAATKMVNSIISQSSDTATLATVTGSLSITSNTTTNTAVISNNLELDGTVTDSVGSTGTAGQLLSSTGVGYTAWTDPIASGLNFVGGWDASVGGGGSPDLTNAALQTAGNYYIVSNGGTAYPNGSPNPPSSWAAGDWVIFADAPANEWQKIDNTSGAIAGSGTVNTIPLWTPSGVQLGNSNIKQDGTTGDISVEFVGVKALSVINADKSVEIGSVSTLTTTGDYSLNVGEDNSVSGRGSIAVGDLNTASATNSIALGSGNVASNNDAFAAGNANNATGTSSTALGIGNTASADGTVALGDGNTASGIKSAAFGRVNVASGAQSTAMGYSSTASGDTATAMGRDTLASGSYSLSTGQNNVSSADWSTSIGFNNTASGLASLVGGQNSTAAAVNSVALGNGAVANSTAGASVVFGNGQASGQYSLSAGFNVENYGAGTGIFGKDNIPETTAQQNITLAGKTLTPNQGLFIVGNGDGTTASNAFKVNWDGRATIYGSLELESTLTDKTGDVGSAGQILSSTGSGVEWINATSGAGTIGGSGTANSIPIFSPDGVTIADSVITQDDTASPTEVNISTIGKFDITNKSITGGDNTTNSVTGTNSLGIGANITVGGDKAAAFNGGTIASKDYSTALNFYSAAYGFDALAAGHESLSLGHASIALGYDAISGLIADGTMFSNSAASTSAVITVSAEEETILDNAKDSATVDGTSGTILAGNPIQINPPSTGNLAAGFFVYSASGILDETEVVSYDPGLSRITLNKDVTVTNLQNLNFFKPYQMVVADTSVDPIDIETTDPAPYITDWDSGTNTATLSSAQTLTASSDVYIFDSDESYGSTAVGYQTRSFGAGAFASGTSSKARGQNSVALGNNSNVGGDNAFATGSSAVASGETSIAMGNNAQATATESVAIGRSVTASGANSVSIGYQNTATANSSTAMGFSSNASGTGSVAIGWNAEATSTYAVALGISSTASGSGSFAVGSSSAASGSSSIALGFQSTASANYAKAIGNGATASAVNSTAIGSSATASQQDSVAIGKNAATPSGLGSDQIALGGTNTKIFMPGLTNYVSDAAAAAVLPVGSLYRIGNDVRVVI